MGFVKVIWGSVYVMEVSTSDPLVACIISSLFARMFCGVLVNEITLFMNRVVAMELYELWFLFLSIWLHMCGLIPYDSFIIVTHLSMRCQEHDIILSLYCTTFFEIKEYVLHMATQIHNICFLIISGTCNVLDSLFKTLKKWGRNPDVS